MTRPASHHEQIPAQRCGNCRFGMVPEYKDDLLCFHRDQIVMRPGLPHPMSGTERVDIELNGETVGLLDGDEYSQVWGGRVVDETDRCDEWRGKDAEVPA